MLVQGRHFFLQLSLLGGKGQLPANDIMVNMLSPPSLWQATLGLLVSLGIGVSTWNQSLFFSPWEPSYPGPLEGKAKCQRWQYVQSSAVCPQWGELNVVCGESAV